MVWAQALRKWFLPVPSSHICSCCCLVDKSSLTLCNPMDCSPQASSVHGLSQARILKWVAIFSSRASSRPGIKPEPPTLAGGFSTTELYGNSHCITIKDLINYIYYMNHFKRPQFSSVRHSCVLLFVTP